MTTLLELLFYLYIEVTLERRSMSGVETLGQKILKWRTGIENVVYAER